MLSKNHYYYSTTNEWGCKLYKINTLHDSKSSPQSSSETLNKSEKGDTLGLGT